MTNEIKGSPLPATCRNFFGLVQHDLWCNHCKRKKTCVRFIKPSVPFTKQFSCNICSEYFSDANAIINHIKIGHQLEESIKDSNKNQSSVVINQSINDKKVNNDRCTSGRNTEKESKDIDNDEIKIEKDIIDNDSNEVPKEVAVNYKKPKDDPEILDFINEVEMKMKEKFKKHHR